MKAQNWLYVSCLIGAFAVYGCGDDATSGGYYGSICGNGVVEDGEACDDGNSEWRRLKCRLQGNRTRLCVLRRETV